MSTKTLIVCPGLRDPFRAKNVEIRTTSPEKLRTLFKRWLGRRIIDLRGSSPEALPDVTLGPALTGIHAMRDWRPDQVLMPYQQGPDMDFRIPACQHVFAQLLPKASPETFVPVPVAVANPADYGRVWRPLHEALEDRLSGHVDADVRILLGPGTPAFNLGLFLFRYRVMPTAKLYQVLNPDDVEAASAKLEADWKLPVLLPLDKPGETLPDLRFDGKDTPEIERLRALVKDLERRAALAETGRDVGAEMPVVGAMSPAEELEMLNDKQRLDQRRYLLAKLLELEAATAEERAPSQEQAAKLLGISRQGFAKGLKSHGIGWP